MTSGLPPVPDDLARALEGRYELHRLLGRGGMATVYLARDRKHGRDVAVKVLRPEIADSLGADRFLAEIQIVARLTHPHILPLHDSGESAGFVYYVAPYIEGGSLRGRLEQRHRLDLPEALAVAAPVADALAYAHRLGVLHRDVKPENILFSQGHAVVADFGIAKAVSSASEPGGARLTRTGIALGTPGYMSPEQAAGFRDVDARSDVYSLAVVVFEMLVGDVPGRWVSDESVRAGRWLEATPEQRARLGAAGSMVEAALVRALAVHPERRTESPAQLVAELRGGGAPRRRYRPDEVDEIVRRAADKELAHPTESGAMSIGGIEAIADEVGIARDLVRSAAAELAPRPSAERAVPSTRVNPLIGGPTRVYLERVVEGELPESEFPALVEEIRRMLRNSGQVSQFGRSFSWSMSRSRARTRDVEVSVTVRGGQTRIVVNEELANMIGALFGGIGGGLGGGGMGPLIGIGVGALHLPGAAIAVLVPAWLATVFAIARSAFFYQSRSRQVELETLIDRLADVTRELLPRSPGLLTP